MSIISTNSLKTDSNDTDANHTPPATGPIVQSRRRAMLDRRTRVPPIRQVSNRPDSPGAGESVPFSTLLAERAGMSKQAMNQLLRSLEGLGYFARSDAPDEAARHEILRDIEGEWSAELGPKHFTQLKALLLRVWESSLIR
jgi:hypothetical protein